MSKRYLVVVPVNKEAYCKSFTSKNEAIVLIKDKIGHSRKEDSVEFFDRAMTMFSAKNGKGKAVNERATYYAILPSAEDDIYGTAIIIGKKDDDICGLTEESAISVKNEINELRVV